MKPLIFPSILSADTENLTEEVISVAKADGIHIDYMEPPFVPNPTIFNPSLLRSLRESLFSRGIEGLLYDVHIMSNNPDILLEDFAKAGADFITVHYEACSNLSETIGKISSLGKKVGVALSPETAIEKVKDYIEDIDLLLVMTVNPGREGQKLIESCLDKIKEAEKLIKDKSAQTLLEVDGGINLKNIRVVSKKGANVFVSGSGIFKSINRLETISTMRKSIYSLK